MWQRCTRWYRKALIIELTCPLSYILVRNLVFKFLAVGGNSYVVARTVLLLAIQTLPTNLPSKVGFLLLQFHYLSRLRSQAAMCIPMHAFTRSYTHKRESSQDRQHLASIRHSILLLLLFSSHYVSESDYCWLAGRLA